MNKKLFLINECRNKIRQKSLLVKIVFLFLTYNKKLYKIFFTTSQIKYAYVRSTQPQSIAWE